ncbi:uncharacterized protein DUF397 [Murinocardiopsis flavida]|uniref:Uncharacterized protein DUF397 n=1 Tax=Murinocardiopsis flavida TaxID=645275 RepID=A0A2P8CSV4_9ACTN|nr:DUF397 domain-containing protein [Murinocardiopsis flavida]PSK88044.1 uncharacterized protein DUF397 [Murinocardiopsis flavida]
MNRQDHQWRKSSYSAGNGNCVEIADALSTSAVRDTQHRELGALLFDSGEWRAFLSVAKHRSL